MSDYQLPSSDDDRRARYAAEMAKRDGHEWPVEFEDDERDYLRRAVAAMAVADEENTRLREELDRAAQEWQDGPEIVLLRAENERLRTEQAVAVRRALEDAADDLDAVDPAEWALAGQHAGHDAAERIRARAAAVATPAREQDTPVQPSAERATLRETLKETLRSCGIYDSEERVWRGLSAEWIDEITTEVLGALLPGDTGAPARECQTPGYTEGPCHCAYHDPEQPTEPSLDDMQVLFHSARDRATNLTVDLAQAKADLDQARSEGIALQTALLEVAEKASEDSAATDCFRKIARRWKYNGVSRLARTADTLLNALDQPAEETR